MSITITIANNRGYVQENAPDSISRERYTCQCVGYGFEGGAIADCHDCEGTGVVTFTNYPFEMNLANVNCSTLFNALGLDFDYCGEIDPRNILKAINRTPLALIVRDDRQEPIGLVDCIKSGAKDSAKGCQVYYGGITKDQAASYQTRLAAIALEAERREDKITWS